MNRLFLYSWRRNRLSAVQIFAIKVCLGISFSIFMYVSFTQLVGWLLEWSSLSPGYWLLPLLAILFHYLFFSNFRLYCRCVLPYESRTCLHDKDSSDIPGYRPSVSPTPWRTVVGAAVISTSGALVLNRCPGVENRCRSRIIDEGRFVWSDYRKQRQQELWPVSRQPHGA